MNYSKKGLKATMAAFELFVVDINNDWEFRNLNYFVSAYYAAKFKSEYDYYSSRYTAVAVRLPIVSAGMISFSWYDADGSILL